MVDKMDAAAGDATVAARPVVVSIVVNFRGLAETRACLDSLLAAGYPAHEIVVVDNDSGNGEAAALESEFAGRARIVASARNLGYGGAANLGLEFAIERGAAYAWALNNDTIVDTGSVARLVEAMEGDAAFGAVSPVIDAPIGPEAPNGIWYAGGVANAAKASTRHILEPIEPRPGIVPTGFVTGCAMFIRVGALSRTGLFWPELFLYWEDVDLCYRLAAAGWKLGVVPSARITHLVHGSVRSELATYYFYRNAVMVAGRHGHARGAARAIVALSVRAGRRWAACTIKGLRPFPKAETRGLAAGIRAVVGRGSKPGGDGSNPGGDGDRPLPVV
jgi:GT2 family glycosyltransferase